MLRIGAIALLFSFSLEAHALTWDDLWLTHNQQGYRALRQGDPTLAAQLFTMPQWQGTAYYRMGDYERALQAFSQGHDAISFYNQGNALAHLGRYQDAIHAYDKALALNIHLDDAQFNRTLLKKMLQSQSQAPKPQATPPFKQNYEKNKTNNQNNPSSTNNSNNDSSATDGKSNSGQSQEQTPSNTTPSSPENLQDLSPSPTEQSSSSSTENSTSSNDSTNTTNSSDTSSTQSGSDTQSPDDASQSSSGDQQPSDPDKQIETESQGQSTNDSDQQQQQALQNVNDDPGELLQRKFARDYAQEQQGE